MTHPMPKIGVAPLMSPLIGYQGTVARMPDRFTGSRIPIPIAREGF